jgi:hypothetical protein
MDITHLRKMLDRTEAHVAGSLWDDTTNKYVPIRDVFAAVWAAGQAAGREDRDKDETDPLPSGAQHRTACPFVPTAAYHQIRADLVHLNGPDDMAPAGS